LDSQKGDKPLITKGASWVLFLTTLVPAAFTPILIGAILVLETSTTSRTIGVLFIVIGVVAVVASMAFFLRKKPDPDR
jgi:hypothetical protein